MGVRRGRCWNLRIVKRVFGFYSRCEGMVMFGWMDGWNAEGC